jgi:hypothetical protein
VAGPGCRPFFTALARTVELSIASSTNSTSLLTSSLADAHRHTIAAVWSGRWAGAYGCRSAQDELSRCRVEPISITPLAVDNRLMSQVAIRCHPCVPVSTAELSGWLEEQVGGLREDVPEGTIRLSHLTQARPTGELDIGWLVELDLPDGASFLSGARCATLLRDLQLLGLQPTVLTALDPLDVAVPSHRHLPVPAAGDTRTDEWERR